MNVGIIIWPHYFKVTFMRRPTSLERKDRVNRRPVVLLCSFEACGSTAKTKKAKLIHHEKGTKGVITSAILKIEGLPQESEGLLMSANLPLSPLRALEM